MGGRGDRKNGREGGQEKWGGGGGGREIGRAGGQVEWERLGRGAVGPTEQIKVC